jgi:hypothetical protein
MLNGSPAFQKAKRLYKNEEAPSVDPGDFSAYSLAVVLLRSLICFTRANNPFKHEMYER